MNSLPDTERDGDEIDQQRRPDAQRDRDRHLVEHQIDHRFVAKITAAEIEPQIVPHHQQEAFVQRLVEAELLFQLLDKFRVEPLRAPVFAGIGGGARAGLQGCLRAGAGFAAAGAADPRGGAHIRAGQLGDDLFHRSAGGELHDSEINHHDPEQGRDDQQ